MGFFEIGEYLSDVWVGTTNQGVYIKDFVSQLRLKQLTDPLTDTMRDLIFGLLGSLSYIGYKAMHVYLANRKKSSNSS